MCARFDLAIPFILRHEGGYAETAAGEVVNRGVNTDTLKALGYKGTKDELKQIVKNLTVEDTEKIYHDIYWKLAKPSLPDALDQLTSQKAANKILDMAVLAGQGTAVRLVQRALGLKEDGAWGKMTMAAAQASGDALVGLLCTVWAASLTAIADTKIAAAKKANNATLEKYWTQVKPGWLARAAWNGM